MNYVTNLPGLSSFSRAPGDPKVLETGESTLAASDRVAKFVGWFSLGLGAAELLAAGRMARAFGMEGSEPLLRAYGMREIAAGILTLSTEKQAGLWSRVAGDGLDIVTLLPALRSDNPKRDNVAIALAAVVGVTLLDVIAAKATSARHSRGRGEPRDYSERSGFPRGVQSARGLARKEGANGGMSAG